MNSQDEGVQPEQTSASRRSVSSRFWELQKALTPSSFATTTAVKAFFDGVITGGKYGILRCISGAYGGPIAEFVMLPAQSTHIFLSGVTGFHAGRQMSVTEIPASRRVPQVLGFLVGSGIAFNVVKQIGFLLANDSAALPLSARQALYINAGYMMGPDLVGAILGYVGGRNETSNEEERLEAEFEKEKEKQNFHELFSEGRRNYRDKLTGDIASLIAIARNMDVPAVLSYDHSFFEEMGLKDTVEKIINAGEKGNRRGMDAALKGLIEEANRKIAAEDGGDIKINPFPTIAEYLAKHDSALVNHLRRNFGEVFFVSKERRYIRTVERITKELRKKKEGRLAIEKSKTQLAQRNEAIALISDLDRLHGEFEQVPDSKAFFNNIGNAQRQQKLTHFLDRVRRMELRSLEPVEKVIGEYFSALPVMQQAAEEAGKHLSDCEWQPFGAKEQNSQTDFEVVKKNGNVVCLKINHAGNEVDDSKDIPLTFVSVNSKQVTKDAGKNFSRGERIYLRKDEETPFKMSHSQTPRRALWKQVSKEFYEAATEINDIRKSNAIEATTLNSVFLHTSKLSDAQLKMVEVLEEKTISIIDTLTRALSEIDYAYERLNNKTDEDRDVYSEFKKKGDKFLRSSLSVRIGTAKARIAAEIINLCDEILNISACRDEEVKERIQNSFLKKYDDLTNRADLWEIFSKDTDRSATTSIVNEAIQTRWKRFTESMQTKSTLHSATRLIDALVKHQDQLIQLEGVSEKHLASKTHFEDLAIICHIEVALENIPSMRPDVDGNAKLKNIGDALSTTLSIMKAEFTRFDSRTGEMVISEKSDITLRQIMADAFSTLYARLSTDIDSLAASTGDHAVRENFEQIAGEIETVRAYIDAQLIRLPNTDRINLQLWDRTLEEHHLSKFVGRKSLSTEEQVEAQLRTAEIEIPESNREETLLAEESVEVEPPHKISQTERVRIKREERKQRKLQNAAIEAEKSEGASLKAHEKEHTKVSHSLPNAHKLPPRQKRTLPQVGPDRKSGAQEEDALFKELAARIKQLDEEFRKQEMVFKEREERMSVLMQSSKDRENHSKEALQSYADKATDSAVGMVGIYTQLNDLHQRLILDCPGKARVLNSGVVSAEYRSRRQKCRFKAHEYKRLGNGWFKEKEKQEIEENKTNISKRPTGALLSLLPDDEIINVTSTVLPHRPLVRNECSSNGEPLYDHVIEKDIELKGGVKVKCHEHFSLPTYEPYSKEQLLKDHCNARRYCSLQTVEDAPIGRTARQLYGLRIHHGHISSSQIERLGRLEIIKPILNNERFSLSEGVRERLKDALNANKNVFGRDSLLELQELVTLHKENGCTLQMWGDGMTEGASNGSHLPTVRSNKPDILNGKVVVGDQNSDFCLVNPTGTLPDKGGQPMAPKTNGRQVYHFAKRTDLGNAVRGDEVTCKKGQVTKNRTPLTAGSTSQNHKQGAKR
jgi:hypothetical protein